MVDTPPGEIGRCDPPAVERRAVGGTFLKLLDGRAADPQPVRQRHLATVERRAVQMQARLGRRRAQRSIAASTVVRYGKRFIVGFLLIRVA